MSKGSLDRSLRRKEKQMRRRVQEAERPPARVYRYKGEAYMRPCGRGINVRGNANQEPSESLDDQICMALGITEGDFEIEIVARHAHPWRKRRQ